jgi:RNA polymerase sigma-54 factor
MTRAAIAQELQVHESTISRAVSSKMALLPNGRTIPLSTFFDRSLPVREALKALIAAEDRPLSDAQLAKRLSKEMGYPIARRTITKYRAMEGIPPAYLRRAHRP